MVQTEPITEPVSKPESEPNADGETLSSKGHKIETKDGITYVDGYLIVNKTYSLPKDYVPENTHKTATKETTSCAECIINEAYDAFELMQETAEKEGLKLWIQSGYRSYSYQNSLYERYVKRDGEEKANLYSAKAGHSEHQSGYAFDVNTIDDSFATTKEGVWINDNCYKYGFIIRYPKNKENETGYKYESWHLRYVGAELATLLYNDGNWITMEDYFGITSEY